MKALLIHLSAGIIILIIALLTLKFITLNLSWNILLISVCLFGYSFFFIARKKQKLTATTVLVLPVCIAFSLLILPELPSLWIAIVLFVICSVLGWLSDKYKAALLLLTVLPLFSFLVVPRLVENDLAEHLNVPAPEMELQALSTDETISLKMFQDKIVIMDFYGTWCKPCIQEIEELKALKANYAGRNDIVFMMVCTDFASDNPTKAMAFLEKYNVDFEATFDANNTVHKSLEFTGVPALVIFDKNGMIRFKHEGYNPSENLKETLKNVIDGLH